MPAIAMVTTTVQVHPHAEALRVYTFEASGHAPVQVVANLENTYAVGDVVCVVLAGSTLLDQTRIKRRRLRGIDSLGMAVGKVDVPPGTDLSDEHCLPIPDAVPVIKWASIGLLHAVRRTLEGISEVDPMRPLPQLTYRAKIKLHGTNAGVQLFPDGRIVPQARNRTLTLTSDNCGFARWVTDNRDVFAACVDPNRHLILFGEWCGPGIQKGVSINRIGRKIFAVFAVQVGDHATGLSTLEIEPSRIRALVPDHPNVYVLPWHGEPVTMDFASMESLTAAAQLLSNRVAVVEERDPWVSEVFGVDGTGEGLVLYPVHESGHVDWPVDRDLVTSQMFKAKGEKHQVRKAKKAVVVAPEVLTSTMAFVDTFVTSGRLEQGLAEACEGQLDMRLMGSFLKWVSTDVRKEGLSDLETAGLTWKQVNKAVTDRARGWLKAKILYQG